MEIRKGFYFSFDAILALTVMSATLVMTMGMMDTNYSSLTQQNIQSENLKTESRDMMSLASVQTFQVYDEGFQNELVSNSVMENSDLEKTVLNGITYLWAAGNFSYAEEAMERYFDPRMNGPYQIHIEEDNNTYTLPRDTKIPENTAFVATASSLVSGHRLNASNEGFRSRARVTAADAERTEIIPISPSGNIPDAPGRSGDGFFETTKYVPITDDTTTNIDKAVLDMNIQKEPSTDYQLQINGQDIPDSKITLLDSEGGGGQEGGNSYYRYNITEYIEKGINNSITYSVNDFFFEGGLLNPGSRFILDYTKSASFDTGNEIKNKRIPLKYVESQFSGGGGGGEQSSGVLNVENFNLPGNADIKSANMTLNAEGVGTESSPTGWDVRASLNDKQIIQESASGQYTTQVNITDKVKPGSNLMQIYINYDGENYWGGQQTIMNSDPGGSRKSYIEVAYVGESDIGDREYEATVTDGFSQNGNPVTYERGFTQYNYFSNVKLFMSVFDDQNTDVEFKSGTDSYQTISSVSGIKPTMFNISEELFDFDKTNYLRLTDSNSDTRFLEYSLVEYSVFVDPRVGYGPVFETEELARQDAIERLEEKSGDAFNFENIEPSPVTLGGEKRLWGPSTVTLVRWEE